MEMINAKDLDLSSMNLISCQGNNSKIYFDGNTCFKIFNSVFLDNKNDVLTKLIAIKEMNIDDLVLPDKCIVDNGTFVGYTMNYYGDSKNMYDFFSNDRFVDINDILKVAKNASEILEKLHNNGIILGDISLDNILVFGDKRIKLCDLDCCRYKQYKSRYISWFSSLYYDSMKSNPIIDENFDRQAMLLGLLYIIYFRFCESMEVYDTLSDKVKTLSDMRFVVEELLMDTRAQIPYLHEFIVYDDEHYLIDRNTQKKDDISRSRTIE